MARAAAAVVADAGGGGGLGKGGGGGLGKGGGGGLVEDVVPQIVKPPFTTEPSVRQVIVEPAAIDTPLGPLLPQYRIEPIVM